MIIKVHTNIKLKLINKVMNEKRTVGAADNINEALASVNQLYEDYEKPFQSLVFANFIVEKSLRRAFDYLHSQELEKMLMQFSVLSSTGLLREVSNLYITQCDSGENLATHDTAVKTGKLKHEWQFSKEPVRTIV